MHERIEGNARISDWSWWWKWVVACALGWSLIGILSPLLGNGLIVIGGILLSLPQWFVLRRYLPAAWIWVIATSIGWCTMWFTGYFVFIAGGFLLALPQWLVLLRVSRTAWWIVASAVGWAIGSYLQLAVGSEVVATWNGATWAWGDAIGGAIGGTIYGVITTNALDAVFQRTPAAVT